MRWFKWFGKDYSAEAMKRKANVVDVRKTLIAIDERSDNGHRHIIIRHGTYPDNDKLLKSMGYSVEVDGDGNSIIRW